jgi:hypothetical protein
VVRDTWRSRYIKHQRLHARCVNADFPGRVDPDLDPGELPAAARGAPPRLGDEPVELGEVVRVDRQTTRTPRQRPTG